MSETQLSKLHTAWYSLNTIPCATMLPCIFIGFNTFWERQVFYGIGGIKAVPGLEIRADLR